jgi:glycosyltransferase involved in cell wall biosynthesis
VLTTVKNFSEIICVDGGSTDDAAIKIKQQYKDVKLVHSDHSRGKSEAVLEGLQLVKTDYVMLFDADIYDLKGNEIEKIINYIFTDENVDMLILRREHEPLLFRLTRGELVLSGERILRTQDLREAYKKEPTGYQLEIAINTYMSDHKKNVYWIPYSGKNVLKSEKIGVLKGVLKEVQMYKNVGEYIGYIKYIESLLFFCRKKYTIKPR